MKRSRMVPMRGGDEVDAFTRWRHNLHWRAGQRRKVKQRYNRRVRRQEKQERTREQQEHGGRPPG